MIKPLTCLSFSSQSSIKSFRCYSGRLKWHADLKALSIKAAILVPHSEELEAITSQVILVATADQDSARFLLSNGFSVALESGTASSGQPMRFHYCIEAIAERMPDETEPA